jgi:hypothetical protein
MCEQGEMCDGGDCLDKYFGEEKPDDAPQDSDSSRRRRRRQLEHEDTDESLGYHMELGTEPTHVGITGHGQINLDRAMMFQGGHTLLHVSDDLALSTDESWYFTVDVSAPAHGAPPLPVECSAALKLS